MYSLAMQSLIQRRMAIERIRTAAVIWLSLGGIWVMVALIQVVISGEFLNLVLGAGWVVIGAVTLIRYRHEIKAFTVENGEDAGRRTGS